MNSRRRQHKGIRNIFQVILHLPHLLGKRVIVSDTKRNLETIASANLAFVGESNSNTQYPMAKNKKLVKNLHTVRKEVKHLYTTVQNASSTQIHLEEMTVAILSEVLTLGETMRHLYEEHVTMHKVVLHMHGLKKQCKYFVRTLRSVQASIVVMHHQIMRYKGSPLNLGRKIKPQEELEKLRVWMFIYNNEQLSSFTGNIEESYE